MAKNESNQIKNQAQSECFQYQLEILKKEIDLINDGLSRLDENGRQIKYLAILAWAGTMGIVLSVENQLRQYAIWVTIIPVIFWLATARWSSMLRKFAYRLDKISDFMNSEKFKDSFEKQELIGFKLLDPRGRQYDKDWDFKKTVGLWRSLARWENSPLYFGLILINIAIGVFFLNVP